MTVYLDPNLYIYSQAEWAKHEFEDRFGALIQAVKAFHKIESHLNSINRIFRFRTSADLSDAIYQSNPTINTPAIQPFYQKQFFQTILPGLQQRFYICPGVECPEDSVTPVPEARSPENGIACLFRELLQFCADCKLNRDPRLVHYEGCRSLPMDSGYFAGEVALPSEQSVDNDADNARRIYLSAADPIHLFPSPGDTDCRLAKLSYSIECNHEILARLDIEWRKYNVGQVLATDNFWACVDRADFRGLETSYTSRLIHAITQIACGRDVNINAHRMIGDQVFYEGAQHTIWNAYVFKMGVNDQDKRCSRIYYIRTGVGAVLWSYDPDAHP